MKISVGNSRTSRAWKIKEFSWEKFVQKCSQTIRTAETVQEQSPQPPKQVVNQQATKTIDVRFYDTTEEFRKAMKALTTQYNIRYGNVPKGE